MRDVHSAFAFSDTAVDAFLADLSQPSSASDEARLDGLVGDIVADAAASLAAAAAPAPSSPAPLHSAHEPPLRGAASGEVASPGGDELPMYDEDYRDDGGLGELVLDGLIGEECACGIAFAAAAHAVLSVSAGRPRARATTRVSAGRDAADAACAAACSHLLSVPELHDIASVFRVS